MTGEEFSVITCCWLSLAFSSWCHPESGISVFPPGRTWETNASNPQQTKYSFKAESKAIVLCRHQILQTFMCVQMIVVVGTLRRWSLTFFLLEASAKFPADVSHCEAREVNELSRRHRVIQVSWSGSAQEPVQGKFYCRYWEVEVLFHYS